MSKLKSEQKTLIGEVSLIPSARHRKRTINGRVASCVIIYYEIFIIPEGGSITIEKRTVQRMYEHYCSDLSTGKLM